MAGRDGVGGVVSGEIPPLLLGPNLPGNSGGPGSGAAKLWSWPPAHWRVRASPGPGGGLRVAPEPGRGSGGGRGPESRPSRLPLGPEPRALLAAPLLLPRASWAAPDAAPRLSLGCLPALCSRIPGRGKWVRKGTALPTPGGPPGPAQPVGTCPSPPEGEASSTRGLNHHFTPEPETGLTSRVSSVQVLGGFWRLVFHSYICVL